MSKNVRVRFAITVPASTPADASVYVAGSEPALGSWKPAGVRAQKVSDRRYEAAVELPAGTGLEFKITRGDWNTAEVMGSGVPRMNRRRRIQRSGVVPVTVAQWGDLKRHVRGPVGLNRQHSVPSAHLGGERRVMVHLPPGYESESRAYPLLVMHDGQNLFDDATSYAGVKWAVDEAVDRLVRQGAMEPVVVAGVWNSPDRMREYHPEHKLAKSYGGFLAEELIPYLRRQYRLLDERTGVAGSSMGGIVSLHLIEQYRDLYTRAGVVSPTTSVARGVAERLAKNPLPPDGRRIWMDMGTLEGGHEYLPDFVKLRDPLLKAGWSQELSYVVVEGGRHHEWDWARRMPQILEFLYPPLP